jgi:AraC-like DNA-binding protein
MCLAAKLLSESALSLDEIAPRVGYETAAAFSKAFRRNYGATPGSFRTQATRDERGGDGGGRRVVRRTDKK